MTYSVPTTSTSSHEEQIEVRTESAPDICGFQKRKSSESLIGKAPVHEDSDNYKMDHPNRGTCLVFNHATYDSPTMNPRMGTFADVKRIQQSFGKLGFSVDVCQDYNYDDIKTKIRKLSKQDHKDSDCVCIIVLTHGVENNIIHARDAQYPLNILWEPFTANNCITLAKKPKIFFISACRGMKLDNGVTVRFEEGISRTEIDGLVSSSYVIPTEADFLFGFSTPSGYSSWRSQQEGTWYIQSLCDVLDKYAATTDLLDILTKTAQEVAKCSSYHEQNEKMHNKKQVPEFHCRLLHRVYLTPKQSANNFQNCSPEQETATPAQTSFKHETAIPEQINAKQETATFEQINFTPGIATSERVNLKPETAVPKRANSKTKTVNALPKESKSFLTNCTVM